MADEKPEEKKDQTPPPEKVEEPVEQESVEDLKGQVSQLTEKLNTLQGLLTQQFQRPQASSSPEPEPQDDYERAQNAKIAKQVEKMMTPIFQAAVGFQDKLDRLEAHSDPFYQEHAELIETERQKEYQRTGVWKPRTETVNIIRGVMRKEREKADKERKAKAKETPPPPVETGGEKPKTQAKTPQMPTKDNIKEFTDAFGNQPI